MKLKLSWLLSAALLTALLLVVASLPSCTVSAQTGDSGAISSAQNTLNTCYEAAKGAEAAGANITSLQDTLNTAGALLSKAELANSQNDFASANSYAQQAQSTLANFVSEANSLKDTASQQTQMSFLIWSKKPKLREVFGLGVNKKMLQSRRSHKQRRDRCNNKKQYLKALKIHFPVPLIVLDSSFSSKSKLLCYHL